MCKDMKWITNRITGNRVLVKCGECSACQQEKASKRTIRIKLESKFAVPQGRSTLFLTLTYENRYIPFILQNEYRDFIHLHTNILHIFREENPHDLKRVDKNNIFRRPLRSKDMIIDTFDDYDLPFSCDWMTDVKHTFTRKYMLDYTEEERNHDLPELRQVYKVGNERKLHYLSNRVGVLYYKDIQDFIKRLRINLERKFNVKDKFSFFVCGEYGPTSMRPHYHLLLHCPTRLLAVFKLAVVASWKFDNLGTVDFERKRIIFTDERQKSKYNKQIKIAEERLTYELT